MPACGSLTRGAEGQALSSALWGQPQDPSERHRAATRKAHAASSEKLLHRERSWARSTGRCSRTSRTAWTRLSQIHTLGSSCTDPRLGLHHPGGPLHTHHIPWFYASSCLLTHSQLSSQPSSHKDQQTPTRHDRGKSSLPFYCFTNNQEQNKGERQTTKKQDQYNQQHKHSTTDNAVPSLHTLQDGLDELPSLQVFEKRLHSGLHGKGYCWTFTQA